MNTTATLEGKKTGIGIGTIAVVGLGLWAWSTRAKPAEATEPEPEPEVKPMLLPLWSELWSHRGSGGQISGGPRK